MLGNWLAAAETTKIATLAEEELTDSNHKRGSCIKSRMWRFVGLQSAGSVVRADVVFTCPIL